MELDPLYRCVAALDVHQIIYASSKKFVGRFWDREIAQGMI
uniref:Uncharacterized protein n=1 Tax=Candidatus Kentrum sp. TC TaxID=2126339 RepID=A0A450ZCY6_9GAMM|nr:MAG: hypothetical protein BECKTC1821E_GA0114239_10975 [Candidatus Kentron sp. TC]VFK51630.1 MAG: hypothetical protein BECKTC1821D_GA0114238_11363 [Candidatus Kentron sp. TC]VFK63581.1 MAG: hypothetical protein BECKTC1821F_GA0114240_11006 [Candidatus Kentron sp. TC]